MTCKIQGCKNPAVANGLCAMHYMRLRRHGDATITHKPGPKPQGKADPDSELARVKKQLTEQRRKTRHLAEWYEAQMRKLNIPRATFAAVINCLHPDKPPPIKAQRAEACGLFTAWKKSQDQLLRRAVSDAPGNEP